MFKVVWRFNLAKATWPSESARQEWVGSADFKVISPYPGTASPWGAQIDLESIEYRPIDC
jgi:hypothetical protein